MASYREKINQEKLSTESGKIAFAIELLERYVKYYTFHEPIEIYDGYTVYRDSAAWIVYRHDHIGNEWYKVFPATNDYDVIVAVLDAQPWVYL